jgi:predicted DNA-binding antitoxin AbrB/MazE fold protein
MKKQVEAVFEEGRLRPLEPLDLPEDARFSVIVMTRDEPDARRSPAETLAEIAALPLEGAADESTCEPTRGATRLSDTNIPPLSEAAFQLNSSIQNLWNTFVGFSGVVVGLLLTAPGKLSGWPRLLACAIYLMFVAVNLSALHKKYGWLGDVLVSLRMAGRKLDEGELAAFKRAVGRAYIPGDWLSKIGHGDAAPKGVLYRLGKWKLFECRLGSLGLGLFAYVVIVLSVLAVFWLFP